ncbi:MAG TPA: Asp-tRNA(Asn)/Glu-tRNA(Gln) amidotransferase subunit GatC [Saprospiraceae bacterium]|nr:Asp-tRNA(Asn)/Glu-tRNA(Gln) amidotransferase subunit GatC [Saprospiraceae bacterium]HMP13550.1 Asp-tRNA(Asn)/Glu-tRNA(Gln) amidotransferase subunit GatC [Saprospiraceae bacterium]
MTVDEQLISRLENLARLELSAEERQHLRQDLNRILAMIEKLQELDTTGVAPLVYVNEESTGLREDATSHQLDTNQALRNAPDTDGVYFRVPKVIDLKN